VIGLSFSSCDDGKRHCWQVTVGVTYEGYPNKTITYYWMTADEIDAACINGKSSFEKLGATDIKITKKKLKLSEEDCKAMNE